MASSRKPTRKKGFYETYPKKVFFLWFEYEGVRFVLDLDAQSNGRSLVTRGKWSGIFDSTTGSGGKIDFKFWFLSQ